MQLKPILKHLNCLKEPTYLDDYIDINYIYTYKLILGRVDVMDTIDTSCIKLIKQIMDNTAIPTCIKNMYILFYKLPQQITRCCLSLNNMKRYFEE